MNHGLTRADILALRLLLPQKLYSPRIDVCSLRFERNIVFDSIQSFCENSRATMSDMEVGGHVPDGYTVRRQSGDDTVYVVLYNAAVKSAGRRRFTLAHEIGHIMLGHADDCVRQEAEANRFAAQLLLPRAFTWELLMRSDFSISPRELAGIFGVSAAVAQNRLGPLKKEDPPALAPDELKLLERFGGLLPQLDGPLVDC